MTDQPIVQRSWGKRIKSVVPIIEWFPQYERSSLRPDVIAGLTLAAFAIPVAIAYASLAGLPPQAGLYCYLVAGVAYAIFGTSRQMAVGPTSGLSIVIAAALGAVAAGDALRQMHLATAVAVLTGFVAIAAWALRLGNITNFVSETVLSGFKVGAGLVIASTQLPKLFGITSGGSSFFSRIYKLFLELPDTNLPSFGVGIGALALLILGERLLPRRPVVLFVVVISIAVMTFFPLASMGVKTVGVVPHGLPAFGWPIVHWSEVDDLLGVALACFLLSYVESISVARTFAIKHGYSISADQDLLAVGMANVAAGIAQGYPVGGGMAQSAVNEKGGARTPLALLVASSAIAIILFFTQLIRNLPDPVLGAIVLIAIKGLIHPKELRHLYRISKLEFQVAMCATIGVLAFGILKGVLLASIFSIFLLLKRASYPRVILLKRLPPTDRFVDAARYSEAEAVPRVLVMRVESGLFYFNAENIKAEVVKRLSQQADVELVVIDLSTTPNIDLAGARMLADLAREVSQTGAALKLAEANGTVRDLLSAEGLQNGISGIARRMSISESIDQREQALQTAV